MEDTYLICEKILSFVFVDDDVVDVMCIIIFGGINAAFVFNYGADNPSSASDKAIQQLH